MSDTVKPIDTEKFAAHLRQRAIDPIGRRILISRLTGSGQEIDLSAPANCNGFGRIRHFRRATADGWPPNPLPIVPACAALGIGAVPDMMQAQVFQNAACAWRCWYCFVPEDLLNADVKRSAWLTPAELIALFMDQPDRPLILDLSGGSPDLVPEWTPWMMKALDAAGLASSTYLWTDDNLSTTYLFDHLTQNELNTLQAYRNYGRVCCFKGYDARSFAFNTRAAEADFARQFEIMRRLLDLDLDLYGYVTLTSPHDTGVSRAVAEFVDRLQALDPNLPLRVVPLQIRLYTPVNARMADRADRERSLAVQEEAIAAWNNELARRFAPEVRALPISSLPLGRLGSR
jgi:uncharacterized Fe-S cluster-containing radical SAM superfamily protein